jgi:hypothetical protein
MCTRVDRGRMRARNRQSRQNTLLVRVCRSGCEQRRLASPRHRIRTVALLWQYSIREARVPISNAAGIQPLAFAASQPSTGRSSGLESGAAACAFHKGKPKRPLIPEMICQSKLTTCSSSCLEQAPRHHGEACDESWGRCGHSDIPWPGAFSCWQSKL